MAIRSPQTMALLLNELERVRREYPGLVHNATQINLEDCADGPYLEVVTMRSGSFTFANGFGEPDWSADRARAAASPELGWRRVREGGAIHWEGRTGKCLFQFYQIEHFQYQAVPPPVDLGPVVFDRQVIEPADLKDQPQPEPALA